MERCPFCKTPVCITCGDSDTCKNCGEYIADSFIQLTELSQ